MVRDGVELLASRWDIIGGSKSPAPSSSSSAASAPATSSSNLAVGRETVEMLSDLTRVLLAPVLSPPLSPLLDPGDNRFPKPREKEAKEECFFLFSVTANSAPKPKPKPRSDLFFDEEALENKCIGELFDGRGEGSRSVLSSVMSNQGSSSSSCSSLRFPRSSG
jgi:hypothetical protein